MATGLRILSGLRADDERQPLVPAFTDSGTESEGESPQSRGVLLALGLCVFFSFGVQSVTTTQLIASSQLEYVSDGPWFFMLVQSVPIVAGALLCVLATMYDESFDRGFGIIKTMHFRIVIVGALTSILAIGIAINESGYAQVLLGFLCAFCAAGAQMAVFQIVAVLNPKWQAAATTGVVFASIIPIQTIEVLGVDLHSQWTMRQRILFFAPSLAFTLATIVLFAAFWPKDWPENLQGEGPRKHVPRRPINPEDPAITETPHRSTIDSPRASSVRSRSSIDKGLTAGLRRLVSKDNSTSVLKWPPFPYWLVSLAEFVNGVMYCVQPLITMTPNSGDKANLIIARFWGEIVGQVVGAIMVFIGLASDTTACVGIFLVMTVGRVVCLFWVIPSLLDGGLLVYHMFSFLATSSWLYCVGTAVVVMAAKPEDRREVSQVDMGLHFVSALVGVAVAAVIIALHH
jgi:hypothetical protein